MPAVREVRFTTDERRVGCPRSLFCPGEMEIQLIHDRPIQPLSLSEVISCKYVTNGGRDLICITAGAYEGRRGPALGIYSHDHCPCMQIGSR